jgi:hypothetical protein
MSGFEFTPLGITPLVDKPAVTGSEQPSGFAFAPAVVARAPRQASLPGIAPAPVAVAPTRVAASAPMTTQNVMKLARARLRDLDREIKRLRALETERDELRRLLAAAAEKKVKPPALRRLA